jgi:uncharacterized protein
MMSPIQLRFARSAAVALLLPLSGCVTFSVREDSWFHPGYAALSDSARSAARLSRGATLEDVFFRSADSTLLHGVFVRTPGARATVLYFGGDNFRVASGGMEVARGGSALGVNVLMMEYRGYGQSEGTPTLPALKQDALEALAYLRARPDAGDAPIVVHGFSMGSFIAAHVAEQRPVAGLVMESTATDVRDWARGLVPWYARPFVRIRMAGSLRAESNTQRLAAYRGPLLLLVGSADRVTRPGMSRSLLATSATPPELKHLLVVPGAGHGDVLSNPAAQARYQAFVTGVGRR